MLWLRRGSSPKDGGVHQDRDQLERGSSVTTPRGHTSHTKKKKAYPRMKWGEEIECFVKDFFGGLWGEFQTKERYSLGGGGGVAGRGGGALS